VEPILEMPMYLPWRSGWPVYCGALAGVIVTAVAGGRRWAARPAFWTATAIAASAASAFLGLLWLRETYRATDGVGVLEHLVGIWSPATQFLSNEQFSMFATLWRLAWILPAVAIVSALVAAGLRLSPRRGSGGSP